MFRVLLIDDHPVIANGLGLLLQEHSFQLAGRVADPDDIHGMIERHRPHVVISESRLGGVDLLGQISELLQARNPPPVVVFSCHDELSHIARAAAIGVYEYVLKSSPTRDLIETVRAATNKAPASESGMIAKARGRMRRPRQLVSDDIPLTRREIQVLQHIAMGLSNREIGTSLDISIETAKEHVQNILRKLDVNDRTQAAVWAVRKNLI